MAEHLSCGWQPGQGARSRASQESRRWLVSASRRGGGRRLEGGAAVVKGARRAGVPAGRSAAPPTCVGGARAAHLQIPALKSCTMVITMVVLHAAFLLQVRWERGRRRTEGETSGSEWHTRARVVQDAAPVPQPGDISPTAHLPSTLQATCRSSRSSTASLLLLLPPDKSTRRAATLSEGHFLARLCASLSCSKTRGCEAGWAKKQQGSGAGWYSIIV